MTDKWFRYVPHNLIAEYEAKGWVVVNRLEGTNHGDYRVLCQWIGEGEPIEG